MADGSIALSKNDDVPRPIGRALLSVYDKTGLIDLGRALAGRGTLLISTGGSARTLTEAGIAVTEISDVTGFPELLDGRVKTLHPKIHGGILGRRADTTHVAAMREQGIQPIDLVVGNLYPFAQTVASGADWESCIEQIDIGGPALARAAAKNHEDVVVATDPADYAAILHEVATLGGTTLALRRRLAAQAFARIAAYDAEIAAWMAGRRKDQFPARLTLSAERREILRYGENPHQNAAFYAVPSEPRPGVATAQQRQGKALSYNNLNDTDAAFELVAEFEGPAVAIIKHANPSGVAQNSTLAQAYERALACDPVSAFGGIVAVNRRLDARTASEIVKLFAEVVIAPSIDDEAVSILGAKTALRVLVTGATPDPAAGGTTIRSLAGGLLLQTRDAGRIDAAALTAVTKRHPTEAQLTDLLFAFRVAKHVKSNAIVYAKDGATVGIGAGQMSRVDSAHMAALKAGGRAAGGVVASDAFFPFADGLVKAIEAGVSAAIQPGGSRRDNEVIAAADEAGIAMVFTGMRHFRH